MPDPNTYSALGWLVVCLAALFHIVNQGKNFFAGFKEQPAPATTYATKEEVKLLKTEIKERFTEVDRELGTIRDQLRADHASILAAGEQRASKIHDRIDDVLGAVSELRGAVGQIAKKI